MQTQYKWNFFGTFSTHYQVTFEQKRYDVGTWHNESEYTTLTFKKIQQGNPPSPMKYEYRKIIVSLDILLGVEAEDFLKRRSSHLAEKWKHPYSMTYIYIQNRVFTPLVRVVHCYMRGYRLPTSKISVHRPQWEDVFVLYLF